MKRGGKKENSRGKAPSGKGQVEKRREKRGQLSYYSFNPLGNKKKTQKKRIMIKKRRLRYRGKEPRLF